MRRRLIILGVLVFALSLWFRPGAVWSEPLKDPTPVAASDAVPAVVSVAAPVTSEQARDNNIYIRHIRTYDLPQNKGDPELPQKIFVLELQVFYPDCSYSDIILDTNVGFGVMRGVLDSTQATKLRGIEIACNPEAGDNCASDAIVIHNASAALFRYQTQNHERTDILGRLRSKKEANWQFKTAEGVLPSITGVSGKSGTKGKEILVAYEGEYFSYDGYKSVRLTFPAGQKKNFDKIQLITSEGYSVHDSYFEDARMPDSRVLDLYNHYDMYTDGVHDTEKMDPRYVFDNIAKSMPSTIHIREAYAWKGGKRINILPYLAQDPFKPFPIHLIVGPLPLGPHSDY